MVNGDDFYARLEARWASGAFVCVGVDPDLALLPVSIVGSEVERVVAFSRDIVDATADYACAFKLNSAFFEQYGVAGATALEHAIGYIRDKHPDCVVIVDAKRGDIDHTNRYYAQAIFDTLGADAVTVHPYMGRESLAPFLEREDKGVIVMGANSCLGVGEFQELPVGPEQTPLYEYICRSVAERWNGSGNCSVTAGATEPGKLARIRNVVGDMPILLLGLGAQGGDIAECLRVGRGTDSFALIPNSSRAILYASPGPDFADAAAGAARSFNQALAPLPSRFQ